MRHSLALVIALGMGILLNGSAAEGRCSIESKTEAGRTFKSIMCDESRAPATQDIATRMMSFCEHLDNEHVDDCQSSVFESVELRRSAMLRRSLKEGESIEESALRHGYTEKEVKEWMSYNTDPPAPYESPEEVHAALVRAEQDLADLLELIE